MLNNTSFTGIYVVNGPSAKSVIQTVRRIKQECQQKQIDCDAFVESAKDTNKKMIVCTEKDAQSCRQNKAEYMSYVQKVREIVNKEPDDINKQMAQMAQMPKLSTATREFLSKIQKATIYSVALKDRTESINKDLDEGTFNLITGMGPNLNEALDKVFKNAVNDLFDSVKKNN